MPPRRAVRVTAPSRLHFGLLSFGDPTRRQFGGCGAMVEQPGLRLSITDSDRFAVAGLLGERVRRIVSRWQAAFGGSQLPPCRMEVESAPPLHTGLGVGTQLTLSIAAALQAFVGAAPLPAPQLAAAMGRGARSAIGTHGFAQGGLLAELGKLPDEAVAALHARVSLPAAWRFVLITSIAGEGLSEGAERNAFDQLPPVPQATAKRLERLMLDGILPAAREARFEDFSKAIQEFGFASGNCFAAVQGGAYNGPQITALVRQLQSLGATGVGQSSWGPTIYAACRDPSAAEALAREVSARNWAAPHQITIAAPNNRGARLETSGI